MKNAELLKFIPNHIETKNMCNHAVKKLALVIRYVSDQKKTQCVVKLLIITLIH